MVTVKIKTRAVEEVDGVRKVVDKYIPKNFDSINFNPDAFIPGDTEVAAHGTDLRTGLSVVLTKNISYYEILANYATYISYHDKIHKEKVVSGKLEKTYGYLDFGLVPVFMPPIGIMTGLEELIKDYTDYMIKFGIKYYIMQPVNPFTGQLVRTSSVKDIWTKRSDIAKTLNVNEENFTVAQLHAVIGTLLGKIKIQKPEDNVISFE